MDQNLSNRDLKLLTDSADATLSWNNKHIINRVCTGNDREPYYKV